MKKLTYFQNFDFANWQKGKEFMVQGVKFNEKRGCVSLDVIITEDDTDYGDPAVSNIYEKFKVHCVKDVKETDVNKYQIKDVLQFKNIGKCEENISAKENDQKIPETGKTVLRQQYALVKAIEDWIAELKKE